jgi:hypothetical protein
MRIIGGNLVSPDGTIHYGAFVTEQTQGAYSMTLGWGQLNQAEAITFLKSTTRTLEADFFDSDGNKASRSLTITLSCSDGSDACKGICGKTGGTLDSNCGACSLTCTGSVCVAGACNPSYFRQGTKTASDCTTVCSGAGGTCDSACDRGNAWAAQYNGGKDQYSTSCSSVPPASEPATGGGTAPFLSEDCCCKR